MKKILIATIALCLIGSTVQAQSWKDKLKKATKNLVDGDPEAIAAKAKRDSIAAASAAVEATSVKPTATTPTITKPSKPKAPTTGTTNTPPPAQSGGVTIGGTVGAPNLGTTTNNNNTSGSNPPKGSSSPPPPPAPSGGVTIGGTVGAPNLGTTTNNNNTSGSNPPKGTAPKVTPPSLTGSFEEVKGIPANAEKTINFSNTSNIATVSTAETFLVKDGDALYAMTNFKAPIQQAFQYLIPTLVVWLDGEMIYISPRTDLMSSQETTIKFQVLPEENSKDGEAVCFQVLNNMLSKLTPGNHKLIVGWTASGGHTYDALGWYGEINLAAGDFKLWTATANNVHAGNVSKNELPKAFISDATLESKMVATTNNYARSQGWKETFTKAVITSDWYTIRHELTGVILGRKRSASICATWPDGHCTFQDMGFKQDYDGSKYSSTLIWNGVGSQTEIECHKIK